ncbi:hypothetical protein BDW74DRAFT_52168 [Aspergillus multicolor]|uniref:uncharacterized protein n=1 Tax=Aspergillus multicolor TaxID=41759 RepID=UPI003CCD0ADB
MSTNRPFLANFLAAFRAQSTYKASTAGSQSATGSSSLSPSQISQGARAIATKATSSSASSSSSSSASPSTVNGSNSPAASETQSTSAHHYHHHHHQPTRTHSHSRAPLNSHPNNAATDPYASPSSPPTSSTPIPIRNSPERDRQRRGSDSSSGSGGFRDALGPEKWYIGGKTAAGEERFYRLGMVTKGGGRLGGSGRVGSIDQLSL